MNPGVIEEVGKVATGVIDSLRTQPATIALIVISFGMMGYIYYEGASYNASRTEIFKKVLDQQSEVNRLLSQCIVPPGKRE
jgi:hypothetical protein